MVRMNFGKTWRHVARFMSLPLVAALGGCNYDLSNYLLLTPKGPIALDERNLILLSLFLMLLVVVPVIIMTFVFARKYRATNTKATYAPHWDHSHKIETVVWGIPCVIILILGVICWRTSHSLDPAMPLQSAEKPMVIDAVSLDWKWLFIYPDQHIATVNTVEFPVGVPVRFMITSDSVMNSFFIPQLGSQIYAMAGMVARLNLIANESGSYDGLSSNYSGKGFSDMNFQAHAVSPADFDGWVASVKAKGVPLTDDVYAALAKPSENDPVTYYSSADPALFDHIVGKYMGDKAVNVPPASAGQI